MLNFSMKVWKFCPNLDKVEFESARDTQYLGCTQAFTDSHSFCD